MPRAQASRSKGFTIIEVLIVLAIAGFVLLIVFVVVPQLRRVQRDFGRKHQVDLIASELDGYRNANAAALPNTVAEQCSFITGYLTHGSGASCANDGARNCALATVQAYEICYHDTDTSSHSYLGELDEISIQLGHWCNTHGDGDSPDDPIAGTDTNLHKYVIWTSLEGARLYCLDNSPG